MKKGLSIVIGIILALMLSITTSCSNTNVNKLIPKYEASFKVEKLTTLTIDDYIEDGEVDNYGLTIVETKSYDENDDLVSIKYRLFSVKTGDFIEGATVEITKADMAPVDPSNLLEVKMKAPIVKITDGMYALATLRGTREDLLAEFDRTISLELYGKNGKAGEVEFEYEEGGSSILGKNVPFDEDEQILYDKDGTRYYVNFNGNLVKETDVLAKILTSSRDDCEYLKDFIVARSDRYMTYEVYDLNGKYVRSFNLVQKFDPSIDYYHSGSISEWIIGNSMYIQYVRVLPNDAKEYDFVSVDEDYNAHKCDVVTKRYDVEKDKLHDIDFKYVVNDSENTFLEHTALSVMAISDDKTLSATMGIKVFDEKLNVYVDLQKLVPDASYLEWEGDCLVVYGTNGEISIVKGKKVIGTYASNDAWDVDVYNNSVLVYRDNHSTYKIYDIEGNLKKTYEDIEEYYWVYEETTSIIFQTGGSVYQYDLATHTETVVATYTENDYVYINSDYVCVTTFGEDGLEYSSDDRITVNFYNEGFDDFTINGDCDFAFEYVGSYSEYTTTTNTYWSIYALWIEDAEGNETVTYYKITESWVYEA